MSELKTNDEELCLNCARMNPVDGYCKKNGEYVNAFWSCKRFEKPEPDYEPMPRERTPRPPRESPLKGRVKTAGRTKKKCSRCGRVLPIDDFVKLKRSADGHGCYCHECNAIRHREYKLKKKQMRQQQEP